MSTYLWSVYRSAPSKPARLVAAEWIGVLGGLTLAKSVEGPRNRRALQKAMGHYTENLDVYEAERTAAALFGGSRLVSRVGNEKSRLLDAAGFPTRAL